MPLRDGPHRGERLGLLCQGASGLRRIRVGESATCRPAAWVLVTQDTGSVTTNFAPRWQPRALFDEPFTLVADDTSIVRTASFLAFGRREGRTTVRTSVRGVEARIAIEVTAGLRLGYDWPVRDTSVSTGELLVLEMVVRDPAGEDVNRSGWGTGHTFYSDSGGAPPPSIEWQPGVRRVHLRSAAPGCVILHYSVGGSSAITHVHFVAPPALSRAERPGARSPFDRGTPPSRRTGRCSASEGPAVQ
jgi:hypothetical protein